MTSPILSNLLICNDVGQVGQLFQSIDYMCANTLFGGLPADLSHLSQMSGCASMGPSRTWRVAGGVEPRSFALSEFFEHEKRIGAAQ